MKNLGEKVIISVYGEKFNNELAREYFKVIGSPVVNIENNIILTKNFGGVRRFSKEDIQSWQGAFKVTHIGYIVNLKSIKTFSNLRERDHE